MMTFLRILGTEKRPAQVEFNTRTVRDGQFLGPSSRGSLYLSGSFLPRCRPSSPANRSLPPSLPGLDPCSANPWFFASSPDAFPPQNRMADRNFFHPLTCSIHQSNLVARSIYIMDRSREFTASHSTHNFSFHHQPETQTQSRTPPSLPHH